MDMVPASPLQKTSTLPLSQEADGAAVISGLNESRPWALYGPNHGGFRV